MTDREIKKSTSHLIGYARVSTEDQDLSLQIEALQRFGVDPRDIYQEKMSGKSMKRPEWQALLKDAREGDTIVVWKVDRIGRSLIELFKTAEELKNRGVKLRSLDGECDMDTTAGFIYFTMMCLFAEVERRYIRERTMAGLAIARAKGRIGGRKRVISDEETLEVWKRFMDGEALADIAAARVPKVTAQAYSNRFTAMGLK